MLPRLKVVRLNRFSSDCCVMSHYDIKAWLACHFVHCIITRVTFQLLRLLMRLLCVVPLFRAAVI